MTDSSGREPELRATVQRSGDRTTVAVDGELDLASADGFTATVRANMAEGPVLLDLRGLQFMDSSGLRAFNTLMQDARREGWSFSIRDGLQEPVRQLLDMTGMMDVLPMEPASAEGAR